MSLADSDALTNATTSLYQSHDRDLLTTGSMHLANRIFNNDCLRYTFYFQLKLPWINNLYKIAPVDHQERCT